MDQGSSSSTPAPQPYYDTPVSVWEPAQHDKKVNPTVYVAFNFDGLANFFWFSRGRTTGLATPVV